MVIAVFREVEHESNGRVKEMGLMPVSKSLNKVRMAEAEEGNKVWEKAPSGFVPHV